MTGWRYHEVLRTGRPGWAWALLGVPLLGLLVVVTQFVVVTAGAVALFVQGSTLEEAQAELQGDKVTPLFLMVLNLGWAAAIPVVWLVVWAVHGLRPGWVASVRPRLRWRWLLVCLGLAVLTLLLTVVVSSLLPAQGSGGTSEVSGHVNDFTRQTAEFLVVIVLLTPLQAVGEEYAFRGYLTQACGLLVRSRVVAVLVPALIFAVLHGLGQPVPVFLDRLGFGIVAGVLVIVTGGLEAGIAMHVLNNLLAFGLALTFGDMTETIKAEGGSWWMIPVTLTQSLVYLALVTYAARRRGLQVRTGGDGVEGPPVLVGRNPAV